MSWLRDKYLIIQKQCRKTIKHKEYFSWLNKVKSQIRQSQLKASLSVNSQLILLYWDLGRQIQEKIEQSKWGSGIIEQLSKDLKAEFPDIGGFSAKNLRYCKAFYQYYYDCEKWQQVVNQFVR